MMRLRKEQGGTSIGPYHWPEDGSVCEVPDELAADLLADPGWGYSREPDLEPEAAEAGEGAASEDGEKTEPSAKPPARRRKTT